MTAPVTHTITARRFFDGRAVHGGTCLTVTDGVVASIDTYEGPWQHDLVAPGFVDLQMNGYDDVSCASLDIDRAARLDTLLLERGTTRWLATIVTDTHERLLGRSQDIARLMPSAPGCVGIHMEGPFLGSRHGAHDATRIVAPDLHWVERLLGDTAAPDGTSTALRMMTLGAEHPEAPRLAAALVSRGVVASLGHTSPQPSQWDAALAAGASMVTHLFNAMSGVHHRDFGMALRALVDTRPSLGLIGDLVHVSADAVALVFATAAGRVCLVSDSVAWNDDWSRSRGVTVRDGAPRLPDGTLAGSSATVADCVRNAVNICGVDLGVALAAATTVPARVVGLDRPKGVSVGAEADLIALDAGLHVVAAWRGLQSVRGISTLR